MSIVWLFIIFFLNILVMNVVLFFPLELLQSLYPSPRLFLVGAVLLAIWCFGDN
jgi:hypothetical protein